jgi:hypothetical protein
MYVCKSCFVVGMVITFGRWADTWDQVSGGGLETARERDVFEKMGNDLGVVEVWLPCLVLVLARLCKLRRPCSPGAGDPVPSVAC